MLQENFRIMCYLRKRMALLPVEIIDLILDLARPYLPIDTRLRLGLDPIKLKSRDSRAIVKFVRRRVLHADGVDIKVVPNPKNDLKRYNSTRMKVILFGYHAPVMTVRVNDRVSNLTDTWTWGGHDWTSFSWNERGYHHFTRENMTYDEFRDKLVEFGFNE